ncbi:MAG: 4-aminobutyrate--2-oxoglutarate transaminase [Anaerolineae bacterium]|nr:4-aminobutyrate--2-oxoglutarate transaminase [Anaerolineae bacterium]
MPKINLVTEIPGPKSQAIVARREAAMAQGNAKLTPLAIATANGATVTDVDGNTLLDFAGGIGMLAVGHCPPTVVGAMQAQAEKLIHLCSIVGSYEPLVELCELLNRVVPGSHPKKTTLSNSGAEAVEAAIKLARAYTGRGAIIVFEGAYHGRTNMTMAMTSKYALFKKNFGPFAPEVYRLPFPNLYRRPPEMSEEGYVEYACQQLDNALIAQVDPNFVAAIVIEPVQGEGGFLPTPPRFLQRIREICTEHDIVMVADEIQCGFGRTGKLFAFEHYDLVPDLMTTGKSLGAGMPIAAVTGKAEIMDAAHAGGLGGTYSGNPLACVAAIESIKLISDPAFLERAKQIGTYMRDHLERIQSRHPDIIGDVRGLGAMLAMEIVKDPDSKLPDMERTGAINSATLQRGLITIRAGLYSNCVRFLPPLTVTDDDIDEAMAVLGEAVENS